MLWGDIVIPRSYEYRELTAEEQEEFDKRVALGRIHRDKGASVYHTLGCNDWQCRYVTGRRKWWQII